MSDTKLTIGMPAGSLADPNRGGNLVNLLKAAGFPTKGYDQGGPTHFPMTTMLYGWDGRPQEFGAQLAFEELDLAIAGDDWVQERMLELKYQYGQEVKLTKALPLNRGHVRIVIIHPGEEQENFEDWLRALLQNNTLIKMVSEMPHLALDWFKKKIEKLGFKESHGAYSVQKYGTPSKIETGIVIYESWGKTEAKIRNGAVHLGMEITQTGSAIRNYGLKIGETVLESATGIWANPNLKQDKEKYELARMFLLNLFGAIYAENKVLLFFNAKSECEADVLEYLRQNKLFADEPTMNKGVGFTEFSVQMNMDNPALPIAKVRYELALKGATHIETVPLDSCIPGLDAVDF